MSIADLPRTFPYQPVRMSVERYHELTLAGAFTEHDSVELLDGVVTEKMSKNPRHRIATRRCDLAFSRIVPAGWHVQNQEPITLQNSEPEPDVAVIRGELLDYADRHPQIGDVALVIEVADTTLVTDRFKAQLYAQAGIPVYWIVNLSERVIEVMQAPKSNAGLATYEKSGQFRPGDFIPVAIDGKTVASLQVSDLLP
jgi:Uma2 family endonuclease